MIDNIKKFIDIFEEVFHNDWNYSNEIYFTDAFEKNETFLQSCWISNWCNRDELLERYQKLKEELSKTNLNNIQIIKIVEKFLIIFKKVFHDDWDYTKSYLNVKDSSEDSKDIHIISPSGTFLYPKLTQNELEVTNWRNRGLLLKQYIIIKELLNKQEKI